MEPIARETWKLIINSSSTLRPSIHARRAKITVKFQDLYGFTVEGNVDDVNVLNDVREKVREQGKVWWALEASKGANWSCQEPDRPESYYEDLTKAVQDNTPATKQIDHFFNGLVSFYYVVT
ncbi:hypothetical protein HAX54_024394 [Datura stramonium]|uniref:Uncharacterized protein n=1 Tax=Datura stramonium TaxID=4076 RepID=A0ABS8UXV3_DATST|nr:hypothetical protein [Datura stramonium]